MKRAATIFSTIALFSTFAVGSIASELPPDFPQIDSANYCRELTSKILDKAEREREFTKCANIESVSREHLTGTWKLVSPAGFKECMKSPSAPAGKSYVYLELCIAHDLGYQCLRGDIRCEAK